MNDWEKFREAWLDFMYAIARGMGVIWLVKKIPFLELKPEYKKRDEEQKTS